MISMDGRESRDEVRSLQPRRTNDDPTVITMPALRLPGGVPRHEVSLRAPPEQLTGQRRSTSCDSHPNDRNAGDPV
jgi:hypothetical protein